MKTIRLALAAITMTVPFAAPAAAQEAPLVPGEYVQMNGIVVEDGPGGLKYAEWLATEWKRFNEYSKSQGWITDYGIYSNVNARAGEPDLYLVVQFKSLPDAAEQERRDRAFDAWSKTTVQEQFAASGNRSEYREVISSMLLQEYKPR
ncbi:hypothetical protein [Erythrobacter donghaensis]|uniref:hypothetical protein n=1 Tax=Erythrobacter donghaensis TaxID=267135 RepID=UPI000A3C9491|nr:hypothetical protein [Erythrobacter donghaensis]